MEMLGLNIETVAKSILHNFIVTLVSFGVGFLGLGCDAVLNAHSFQSAYSIGAGAVLLLLGFGIRVWAAYLFYKHKMRVIVLEPQNALITNGPYRFSRNPLYLGGNLFMFLGASLVVGSPSAIAITIIGIFITDFFIRREERQLSARFGEEWQQYAKRVGRWI
jgi:protein-S-isoprenylcysteine O-methyltransferase Ste14